MKEVGIINRNIAAAISKQGHQDLLMVTDAGFAIPDGIEVIDISLGVNKPLVPEVLSELKKYFSVEKMIMARQTREVSPSLFDKISKAFGDKMEVEVIDHSELKN